MKAKNKAIWALVALLAVGVTFFIALKPKMVSVGAGQQQGAKYYCPMHPHYTSDKPGDCPICHMRLVPIEKEAGKKKILFYRNPMNPEITSPVPAKDEMGMDYVPVYAEAMTEEAAGFTISPQKQQLIGVKTSVAEKRGLVKVIKTVGKIAYDPELYQAQAELIQSLKSLNAGQAWAGELVESSKIKLTLMGLSSKLIEEIEQSDAPDKTLLYSVPGGQAWVYATIYEYEIPLVKIGDWLELEVPALPGVRLQGEIRSIDTVVDPMTRSVKVRAQVPNKDGFLKPDLYVNASLRVDLGESLAVPEEAVFFTGTSTKLFVEKGEGRFEPRAVLLGQKAEGYYEVKEGLQEGEKVVSQGNFLVDSESRLKAALSGMSETDEGQHQHD